MKKKFSISTKIWFSISLLILGYLISMVFDYVMGQKAEFRLQTVSETTFPAAKLSQVAVSEFNEQVKLYGDSVMLGEETLLQSAQQKAAHVRETLLRIHELDGLDDLTRAEIRETVARMDRFTQQAQVVYKSVSTVFDDTTKNTVDQDKLEEKAQYLNDQTNLLKARLERFERRFSNHLKQQIAQTNKDQRNQQVLNAIVFVVVVTIALTLIAFIISHSIMRPLKKTFLLENAVKQSVDGIAVFDLSGQLTFGNQAWAELHGYQVDELPGLQDTCFFTPDQYAREYKKSLEIVKTEGSVKREVGHQKRNGSLFPSFMSINLLNDRNMGQCIVTIARDITKEKEAQEKLAKRTYELNVTLEKVEEANRQIMESIQYAKMIQDALLPNYKQIKQAFPDSFIIWMPRDIVGGDFFFSEKVGDGIVLAVGDCTGHGVPGALMTMVASSGMRRIVMDSGCDDPSEILQRLNVEIKNLLHKERGQCHSDVGLDAAVCYITPHNGKMIYSGAKMPLYFVKNGEVNVIKPDRQSLGYKRSDENFKFTNQQIEIDGNMAFYLSTDGFIDQLGGENRRRFGTKRFYALLEEHATDSFEYQQQQLMQAFLQYKGDCFRQDDVTVIGFSMNS